MLETSVGDQNKSQEKQESKMQFTTPPTMSLSEQKLLLKTQLYLLMQLHSNNGIYNTMVLNLERRRQLKKVRLQNQLNRASTSKLFLRRDKLLEFLITMLQTNSMLVDFQHAFHQDQDSQEELTDTSQKAKSLNFTSRKWKRRRSELFSLTRATAFLNF